MLALALCAWALSIPLASSYGLELIRTSWPQYDLQIKVTAWGALALLFVLPALLVPLLRRRYAHAQLQAGPESAFTPCFSPTRARLLPQPAITKHWSTSAGLRLETCRQTWFDRLAFPILIPTATEDEQATALGWIEANLAGAPEVPCSSSWLGRFLWIWIFALGLVPVWIWHEEIIVRYDGTPLSEFLVNWGFLHVLILLLPIVLWARSRNPIAAIPGMLLLLWVYFAYLGLAHFRGVVLD